MKKSKLIGFSSLLAATFLYGFFGIFTRIIGFKLPLFFACWTRTLISAIILFLPFLFLKNWVTVKKNDMKWIVARATSGLFGFFGSYIAFYNISIGTAYFIFYAGTLIWGYFLGRILFKEKLTFIKIVSLFLALGGLLLIYSLNFRTTNFIYALSALISGFGSATWSIFSKKISGRYSALQLNFMDTFIMFLMVFILSLMIKEPWSWPNFSTPWLASLLFAGIFILTGQLMIYGFKHLDAQIGSLIMLTEVLFGIILGFLFYKEVISLSILIGGLIIIFSIILPQFRKNTLTS